MHKYSVGQLFTVKSGNTYVVLNLCNYEHRSLKGEPGYTTRQLKNGKLYGPLQLTRESNIHPVAA